MACKKCDPHEICEECPEWIFTLADLIMCMMGLFVLLWVLKPTGNPKAGSGNDQAELKKQEQKLVEQVAAIREAFGYHPDPNSADPVDQAMVKKAMRLVGPGEKGTVVKPPEGAQGEDENVTNIRPSKINVVGTRIPFAPGESKLTPDDIEALKAIVLQVKGTYLIIIVKGHAYKDDFPQGTGPEPFLDLSIKRAKAVADYLISNGVLPQTIRVQGCSTYEPIRQDATSPQSRDINRRVELEVTNTTVKDMEDPRKTTAKSWE